MTSSLIISSPCAMCWLSVGLLCLHPSRFLDTCCQDTMRAVLGASLLHKSWIHSATDLSLQVAPPLVPLRALKVSK